MDTKQKTRPADARQRSRTAAKKKAPARRRTAEEPQRRRTAAPEETRQRRSSSGGKYARTGSQTARPAAHRVSSDAPEMVFKPTRERNGTAETGKKSTIRERSERRVKERQAQKKRMMNRPAVVYTDPKPININKMLMQAVVVLAVVLAIVMGLSVFFKVEQVVVYGNKAYTAWNVQEAAGIEGGENLMTFNTTRACGKIRAELPYVKTARIGIKLPDTVNIYIEEIDVAYAIQSDNGTWWLMTSAGNVVEQIDAGTAGSYTKILGVELDSPDVGQMAKPVEIVAEVIPEETSAEGETLSEPFAPVIVTGQNRLDAALTILSSLELNGIVGEAASINVDSLSNIELWYGQKFQVKLGDINNMDYKISCMKTAIQSQMKEYDMGVLDVSFTTWTDQVGYTPFSS
ncbi:MAG: FtsQ-type POTRA domain-containing protein [Oscillospiraceae bacterium]|nr:FtsQ-type POTRA domain-containing protein [Oscillospiraceae bacterium]